MPAIDLRLAGDGAFADYAEDIANGTLIHLANDAPAIRMATLDGGMASGAPSIVFGFRLPDGRAVMVETSVRVLQVAMAAINARYGDLT